MASLTSRIRPFNVACRPAKVQRCRSTPVSVPARRYRAVVVRAQAGSEDDDFEKRLAKLKKVKSPNTRKPEAAAAPAPAPPKEKTYDFSNEEVFFEGPPATGDLVTNIALGTTLLWLPLTFAAVGRSAFVRYRVTDKRIQVTTTLPWKTESAFVAYDDVRDVVAISRGLGYWGDMVVTKRNGEKLEIRAIEKWKEIRDYIREKAGTSGSKDIDPMAEDYTPSKTASAQAGKGFRS